MNIKLIFQITVVVLISIVMLSGCVTTGKNTLPRGDMTMATIYKRETGLSIYGNNSSRSQLQRNKTLMRARHIVHGKTKNTRKIQKQKQVQINNHQGKHTIKRFRILPNPEITIHVYPHMAHANNESQPVPGYDTAFFMYKENHFAMPSESINQEKR